MTWLRWRRFACQRCPALMRASSMTEVVRHHAGRRYVESVCANCVRDEKARQRERRRGIQGVPPPTPPVAAVQPRVVLYTASDPYYPCRRRCAPACPACFSCDACRFAGMAEACRHLLPRGI